MNQDLSYWNLWWVQMQQVSLGHASPASSCLVLTEIKHCGGASSAEAQDG